MNSFDEKRRKTACFTGHRNMGEPIADIEHRLFETVESLIRKGYLYFGAGGARGFDALASEVVLKLKTTYPQIHLILVLPFDEQYSHEKNWTRAEVEQYHRLRTCTNRRCTPSGRVFSRHSALFLLEIHKVFPRRNALIGGKIPRPSGIPRLSVQVLKERASKVVVLADEYSSGVYYRRNRHLVDNSSVCVAYMNRANSGTSYTVNYARAKRLQVVNTALF